MHVRARPPEAEVAEARGEAEFREEEVAQLQSEVAVLQVRQRAMGVGAPRPLHQLWIDGSGVCVCVCIEVVIRASHWECLACTHSW